MIVDRLTRFGETVTLQLVSNFIGQQRICIRNTLVTIMCTEPRVTKPSVGSHQDSTDLSVCFSSKTTPCFGNHWFWKQQPWKVTGNLKKTPWPTRRAERENHSERSALSHRIRVGSSFSSYIIQPPVLFDFKVKCTPCPPFRVGTFRVSPYFEKGMAAPEVCLH